MRRRARSMRPQTAPPLPTPVPDAGGLKPAPPPHRPRIAPDLRSIGAMRWQVRVAAGEIASLAALRKHAFRLARHFQGADSRSLSSTHDRSIMFYFSNYDAALYFTAHCAGRGILDCRLLPSEGLPASAG